MHFDAMLSSPRRYAQAAWSRIIGKRLRSRLMLAPLLGRSRWAYALWLSQQETCPDYRANHTENGPSIVALVPLGSGIELTLASLASENIEVRKVDRVQGSVFKELSAALSGLWVLPLASGDVLAPGAGALYRKAAASASDDTQVIYADDDIIDERMRRSSPHLKPDWNSELFKHFDYLTGSALIRAHQKDMGDLPETGWAQELVSRTVRRSEGAKRPVMHLHEILHHRRSRFSPVIPPPQSLASQFGQCQPSVSVIVPTRNRLDLLRNCLEGLARTEYAGPLEILVVDNGSDDSDTLNYLSGLEPVFAKVLRDDGPFNFAALNNRAAEEATGDLLCFLNNDIEIIDPAWLTMMAGQAQRENIGAVGARLLYPDGRIQHAGVVLGVGGGAAHAHRLLDPSEAGYFSRHSVPQFVSAVTAACLVVQRRKFLAIGGFDAENFAVSFNDVDLCMRLGTEGWHSLYEARATLVHHESVSRGLDRDPVGAARLSREVAVLQERWGPFNLETDKPRVIDPFHHPRLSRFSEQFVLEL